ncbi:MAG: DUF3142 domain-containing protein [Verrucomicrobiales bacterium]
MVILLAIIVLGIWAAFRLLQKKDPVAWSVTPVLEQSVYVWQRDWNKPVKEAFAQRSKVFSSLTLLGAEIRFGGQKQSEKVAWAEIDWPTVKKGDRPVGVAIRIGTFSGPFQTNSMPFHLIKETATTLLEAARDHQVAVNELHIDFDCAESKLAGYAIWLRGLQKAFPGMDITITALPAWLKSKRAFAELVRTLPRYVLQVHSLEHPQQNRTPYLCNPERAMGWIEEASRFQKAFLVALPTYSYLVAEDKAGTFIGIKAEGDWNAREHKESELTVRRLSSSPRQMAGLVSSLRRKSPSSLMGIIWYRLPVQGDQLNWRWTTLAQVMAGEVPKHHVNARVANPKPGLCEIFVENSGSDEYSGPVSVNLAWSNSYLVASDALGPFTLIRRNGDSAVFASTNYNFSPQSSIKAGWLRFNQTNEVSLEVKLSIP